MVTQLVTIKPGASELSLLLGDLVEEEDAVTLGAEVRIRTCVADACLSPFLGDWEYEEALLLGPTRAREPPAANPLRAQIVGLGISKRSLHQPNIGSWLRIGQPLRSSAVRSAPEQKARPAPVITKTRASSSEETSPNRR